MEKGLLRLGGLQATVGCYGYATLLRYATERLVASRQQPWTTRRKRGALGPSRWLTSLNLIPDCASSCCLVPWPCRTRCTPASA